MPQEVWVLDQSNGKARQVRITVEDDSVGAVKRGCKKAFRYDGPLYDCFGKAELIEEKVSVTVAGKYCHKNQTPLRYGKPYSAVGNFVKRTKCSKRAILIWSFAALAGVALYIGTHWAHTQDFASDLPYMLNVY